MKTFVSATPHQAVMAYLAWSGWNMTRSVTAHARERAVIIAGEASTEAQKAGSLTLWAFSQTAGNADVAPLLKGNLDYSPLQDALYGAGDATLETYHALAKVGAELDIRISGLEVAIRIAEEDGQLDRSRDLTATHLRLTSQRLHLTLLTILAGGLWHLQSQEG